MSIYQEAGYLNREHYLKSLSEEFDIPYEDVIIVSEMLGEAEDFDSLPIYLGDYHNNDLE